MAVNLFEAQQYGAGKGDAFLWGENKALKGLQDAQKQEQLRRQKEEIELADELSKINLDGVRDADLAEVSGKYDGVKNIFHKLRGATNRKERMELQSELQKAKAETIRLAKLSKTANEYEAKLGEVPMREPDNISEDYVPRWSKIRKMPLSSPEYQKEVEYLVANGVLPKFDNNAYSKILADRSIENVSTPEETRKDGRLNRLIKMEGSKLNQDNLIKNAANAYTTDRSFRRFIDTTYKGVPANQAVIDYAKKTFDAYEKPYNLVKEVTRGQWTDETSNKSLETAMFKLANGVGGGSDGGGATTAEDLIVPIAGGKGQIVMRGAVKVPMATKNFAGTTGAIDMSTGEVFKGRLPSSNNYEVVTVGNVDIIPKASVKLNKVVNGKVVSTDNKNIGGALAQQGYKGQTQTVPMIHVQTKFGSITKDFLIPYDRMPQNLTKKDKEILSGFVPATQTKTIQPNKSVNSTVTVVLPNGRVGQVPSDKLAQFMKDNPKAKRQ